MTKAIEILATLAEDVSRSVADLNADDLAMIDTLKAKAAEMSPIMTITEPNEPDEQPLPEPDPEPHKNPKVV